MLKNTTVDISVTEAQLVNLHKFTEYQIWVTAFTTRDGWLSNTILIRTHEDRKFCVAFLLIVTNETRRGIDFANITKYRNAVMKQDQTFRVEEMQSTNNHMVYYRLSHNVVSSYAGRDVSTAYC